MRKVEYYENTSYITAHDLSTCSCRIFDEKKYISSDHRGKKNINDLVIYLILPCNILHAFTQSAADGNFIKYLEILLISIGIQVFCVIYGKSDVPKKNRKDDINVFSMEPSARMRDFLEIRSQREFMAQKVWCLPVFI